MQVALKLFFWLLLRVLKWLSWFLRLLIRDAQRFPRMEKVSKLVDEHLIVLRSALVELHEAQSFFIIAIQVGIYIVLSLQLGDFQAYSTTELQLHSHFLHLIEAIGVFTVSLVLILLQYAHLLSFYIYFLSCIAVIITLINIKSLSNDMGTTGSVIPIPDAGTLDKCGGHSPPIALCSRIPRFYNLW